MGIDWNVFEKYWKPTQEVHHKVLLTDWDTEYKTFNNNEKMVLKFRVLNVDGEIMNNNVEFSCGGKNALQFKPIIIDAMKRGDNKIFVNIRAKGNIYEVADMYIVNDILQKMK